METYLSFFILHTASPVTKAKDTNAINGIVMNPNHSKYFVVHDIPCIHGATLSGNIFQYNKLWYTEITIPITESGST